MRLVRIALKNEDYSTMNQKRILVIDDEQDIRNQICRILEGAGYGVRTADSLRNAIQVLVEEPLFDMITCDIMIPQAGGFELIEQIKADPAYRHIPILMVTGMDTDVLRASMHQADGVLHKPFSSNDLLDQVKMLCK